MSLNSQCRNKITLLLYIGLMRTPQPTKVNDSSKTKAENTILNTNMLYEVINNLDGFNSRLVKALQLLLNLQFLFLIEYGISVSISN